MRTKKVLKYNFKADKETMVFLRFLCHVSKNVFNTSLFKLRDEYFNFNRLITKYELIEYLKSTSDYRLLEPYVAGASVVEAYKLMEIFMHGKRDKKRFPNYMNKKAYYTLSMNGLDYISKHREGDEINFPLAYIITNKLYTYKKYNDKEVNDFLHSDKCLKPFKIKIPSIIKNKEIQNIQIIPKYDCKYFTIAFTYMDDKSDSKSEQNKKGTLSIDLGVNNLATCVNSKNIEGFIVDGKKLKSKNQFYNKEVSYYNSLKSSDYLTKKVASLYINRNNYITNYIYKAAKIIVDYVIDHNIKTIVVGWSEGFERRSFTKNSNMTNANKNQIFKQIPFVRLKHRIKLLCSENDIEYKEVDESFTSKCSFYDGEIVSEKFAYKGKRVRRGLFRTNDGRIVNADINGALNILKKGKTESDDNISRIMNSGVITPMRRLVY